MYEKEEKKVSHYYEGYEPPKYKTTYEEVRALILEGGKAERERVERKRRKEKISRELIKTFMYGCLVVSIVMIIKYIVL